MDNFVDKSIVENGTMSDNSGMKQRQNHQEERSMCTIITSDELEVLKRLDSIKHEIRAAAEDGNEYAWEQLFSLYNSIRDSLDNSELV